MLKVEQSMGAQEPTYSDNNRGLDLIYDSLDVSIIEVLQEIRMLKEREGGRGVPSIESDVRSLALSNKDTMGILVNQTASEAFSLSRNGRQWFGAGV